MHIAERVDMHHEADGGDDDEHHHRNRRQAEAQGEQQLHAVDGAEVEPGEVKRSQHRIHPRSGIASDDEEIFDGGIIA